MERHLTVSGFVVHDGRTALHWHRKNSMWLPAGGHIEAGESPAEAVLREIGEEYGLKAAIARLAPRVGYRGGPVQEEPPYTVLICPVENCHEHIDLVYFCRVESGFPGQSYDPENPIRWFNLDELAAGAAPVNGSPIPFPPDVQTLGAEAIRLVSAAEIVKVG